MTTIMDDPREINSAWVDEEGGATVGHGGVTSIKPYEETVVGRITGEPVAVLWLAVFKGEEIVKRLNATFITDITYFPKEEK